MSSAGTCILYYIFILITPRLSVYQVHKTVTMFYSVTLVERGYMFLWHSKYIFHFLKKKSNFCLPTLTYENTCEGITMFIQISTYRLLEIPTWKHIIGMFNCISYIAHVGINIGYSLDIVLEIAVHICQEYFRTARIISWTALCNLIGFGGAS